MTADSRITKETRMSYFGANGIYAGGDFGGCMAEFERGADNSERAVQHRFPSPFGPSPSGSDGADAPDRRKQSPGSSSPDQGSTDSNTNFPQRIPSFPPAPWNSSSSESGIHKYHSPFDTSGSLPEMPLPQTQEKDDPSIPPFVMPRPDDVTPDTTLPPIVVPDGPFPNFPKPGDLPTQAPDHLPPFRVPGDRVNPLPPGDTGPDGGRVFELRRLNNRAADHIGPDAVVRLPADFDPSKPINLVIYNHGWGSTVQTAYRDNKLGEQMNNAPPNTVLIVPEWQRTAGANNGDQGNFRNSGVFANMLQEVFDKTTGLAGKSLNDVASIGIFAHSAGYGPAETEIYKNGLGKMVTSITLLDSLYDSIGFDSWIRENASDLAAGRKQFYNFFQGTSNYSMQLANRMRALIPSSSILTDYDNPKAVMDASTLARYPVVFKYSTANDGDATPHYAMPHLYVGPVEAAARMRKPGAIPIRIPGEGLPPFRF